MSPVKSVTPVKTADGFGSLRTCAESLGIQTRSVQVFYADPVRSLRVAQLPAAVYFRAARPVQGFLRGPGTVPPSRPAIRRGGVFLTTVTFLGLRPHFSYPLTLLDKILTLNGFLRRYSLN